MVAIEQARPAFTHGSQRLLTLHFRLFPTQPALRRRPHSIAEALVLAPAVGDEPEEDATRSTFRSFGCCQSPGVGFQSTWRGCFD